jgi:hypothetical protein
MLIFISLSLAISFIVQTENPARDVLSSPLIIYLGLAGAGIGILGSIVRKRPERLWYDLFAGSTLLIWFAYWQPLFGEESPMFFFFPLFFAFMAAFLALALIGQKNRLDSETLRQMRILSEQNGLQPWVIMLCVLGSLELQEHYLIYPVMTVILLLRHTLSACIERGD